MEAFTRLQPRALFQVEGNNESLRKSKDGLQKTKSKTPSKRNLSLPKTSTALVPVLNPIYENLDPLSDKLRNFSLPRIRQLWCVDPNCTYNSHLWSDHPGRISRPESVASSGHNMPHHLHRDCGNGIGNGNGTGQETYGTRMSNQKLRRTDGDGGPNVNAFYEEDESRGGAKLKSRPDISPVGSNTASNSTESTGISSRNKRNEMDVTEHLGNRQFALHNADLQHSFRSTNSRNGRLTVGPPNYLHGSGIYQPTPPTPYCPSCNGVIPLSHLETIPEMSSFKGENGLWNFNNFHYPLQRDNSIGGFTLNGQHRPAKKSKMAKFCSSHKIALVVSTFSLLVTIGLIIALLFMKKRGMMEPM